MKQIKIIITGAQCSGKSSLIRELAKEFECLNETALEIFRDNDKLVLDKNNFKEFNGKLTKRQIQKETDANNKIVFLDRSLIDQLLFCNEYKIITPNSTYENIKSAKYTIVFFLQMLAKELWNKTESDKPRHNTYEEGARRGERLLEIYKQFDIPIIVIPVRSVKERAEMIKKELKARGLL